MVVVVVCVRLDLRVVCVRVRGMITKTATRKKFRAHEVGDDEDHHVLHHHYHPCYPRHRRRRRRG